jgi:L-asparagine transporter-like permease
MYWFAWTAVIVVYFAVSLLAVYMTYSEHQRNGQRSIVMSALSYLLCFAWPLIVACMYAFARWQPAEFAPADRD